MDEEPEDWDVPVMPPSVFRERGYLAEVNRQVLHPLGLAMFVDPDTDEIGVYDGQDDPEGWRYVDETEPGERQWYEASGQAIRELEQRSAARVARLGYIVQPLPSDP